MNFNTSLNCIHNLLERNQYSNTVSSIACPSSLDGPPNFVSTNRKIQYFLATLSGNTDDSYACGVFVSKSKSKILTEKENKLLNRKI